MVQDILGGSWLSCFFLAPKLLYLASNTIAFENLILYLAFKSSRWSCAGRRHAEPTAAKTSLGAIAMYMCGGEFSRPSASPRLPLPSGRLRKKSESRGFAASGAKAL